MLRLPPSLPLTRYAGQTPLQHAERLFDVIVGAALAASIALVLTGCATEVAKPSVNLPAGFAASTASEMEPEAAWWETFKDPVLTDARKP